MNQYDVGDVIRVSGTFTDSSQAGVDPSSVTFQYRQHLADPSSVTTLIYGINSVTRVSTGSFFSDVPVNSGGEWRYRWNGTGANAAAIEGAFLVRWRSVG